MIVADTVGLASPGVDGEDLYWLEQRPQEGGRSVLVRRTQDGQTADLTPAPFNVRTRVHEYGGGAYIVSAGTAYFRTSPTSESTGRFPGRSLSRFPRRLSTASPTTTRISPGICFTVYGKTTQGPAKR